MQLAEYRPELFTPTLESLYTGPLEHLAPPLVLSQAPRGAMQGAALRDPARLDALLTRFAAEYGHGDRRGVASLWSKWHFNALLAPTLAVNLLLDRELPIALERVHVVLSPERRAERLCLEHAGSPLASRSGLARFLPLLDGHLAPLIEVLSGLSGAAPRVFWSNVGNVFEYFIGVIKQHPLASAAAIDEARLLLDSRQLPDGRRNPLYRPVRYIESSDGEVQRVRKLCCLRYLLPEVSYCGNCPLESCDRRVRL